jgi:hypothetical protein
MNELNKKLAVIQQKLKAPKSQFNKFANFNYRSCEDILEAVKPLLGDLTLIIQDDIVQVGDRHYIRATVSLMDGTNSIGCSALAREPESKTGMDASQITGAASSYARKYALNGLFLIDDTKDADTQDNRVKETPKKEEDTDDLVDLFREEDGSVARDSKGHTACVSCGKAISERVEQYSIENFDRALCVPCQAKEKAKNAKA